MAESYKQQESSESPESENPENIIAKNKVVAFNYRLSEVLPDGEHSDWLEHTKEGEPLYYLHGFHNVVVGLEQVEQVSLYPKQGTWKMSELKDRI